MQWPSMTMMMPLKTEYCATARRYRVPMHMRDSQAPMITDGTDDPFGLHRPGWRIASGGSERDVRSATASARRSKTRMPNIQIASLTPGRGVCKDGRSREQDKSIIEHRVASIIALEPFGYVSALGCRSTRRIADVLRWRNDKLKFLDKRGAK